MLEAITPLFDVVLPWLSFAAYVAWYLTSAKRYAQLTAAEVKALWEIHKQRGQCKAKRWKKIRHGDKIVGFECGCGYKYAQKRPIL